MKFVYLMLIVALFATVSLTAIAQDEAPVIDYLYNGVQLQKTVNGEVVQEWTMPNSLDTQYTVASLKAQVQVTDPAIRYDFDEDHMYHLRGNQVVDLWLLRAGQWTPAPILTVQYAYSGTQLQRFVNDQLQQTWTLPNGRETQQVMAGLQAEANKIVAEHAYEELYIDGEIEHLPMLVAADFRLHYVPVDGTADWSWYTPDVAELLISAETEAMPRQVILAVDDLVITQHPAGSDFAKLLGIPSASGEVGGMFYDVYRINDGQISDLWLCYDLSEHIQ